VRYVCVCVLGVCVCVCVYMYKCLYVCVVFQPDGPAGPRTPAAAARIALVWRCGGDLVFSWGNTRCVEARERREDSTYEKK